MNKLYSVSIYFYYYMILLTSLFNKKAKLWLSGRKNWKAELSNKIDKEKKWIWFHCSSLGEFEDSCEVFIKIKKDFPEKKTLLTVFSPSAFEVLKHDNLFDEIAYLPLDTNNNAETFLNTVNPEFILISRSELWPNFLRKIREKEIPTFLISFKLSKESNFIKWPYNILYKNCLNTFKLIFCQNNETQKLLQFHFNITNSTITGNTRFERVYTQSKNIKIFPDIEKFTHNCKIVVIGSSLPTDEKFFLEIYNELKTLKIKWIIVPHEIEKSILMSKVNPKNIILYSKIKELSQFHDVLLIDSVGILKYLYQYANFALIGGGFDKIGIHNIIEPAIYGVQSAFGPNHKNYEEAIHLLNIGGASIYNNSTELKVLLKNKLQTPANINLVEIIKQYVKSNTSNSSKIVDLIHNRLNY